MKKIILLSALVIVSALAVSQVVYAANATLSVLPSTASHNTDVTFNVSVNIDPQGNKVCVVKGTLNFNNLTCSSISVASGIMAAVSPTCASPTFTLGIPKCTTVAQNILTASVFGSSVGQATASFTGAIIGAGTPVAFTPNSGAYSITVVSVPTPTPAQIPATKQVTTPTQQVTTPTQQAITPTQEVQTPSTTENNIPASVGAASFLSVASPYFWLLLIIFIILVVGYVGYYLGKRKKK